MTTIGSIPRSELQHILDFTRMVQKEGTPHLSIQAVALRCRLELMLFEEQRRRAAEPLDMSRYEPDTEWLGAC